MKKLILVLFVLIGSFTLLGCNTSEFKVDGEFTAYLPSVSSNKPQVTMVTVTIEDGEIVGYDIDVRQGTRTATGDPAVYSWAWNTQTKKELGYNYHMHYNTYAATDTTPTHEEYITWLDANDKLDWFEQAEVIEAYWLANGYDSIVLVEGEFPAAVGVTISDSGYVALAAEAVANAKLGKFQSIVCSGTDLYSASMIVSAKGVVSELKLDTLQPTKDTAAGTFVWKTQTKQQLGDAYGMKNTGTKYTFAAGVWTAGADKSTLEWYEQANLITAYILENGWNGDLAPIADRGVSLDGTTLIDACAGVSIKTATYFQVLEALFGAVAEGEIK
ncbi:MAG: hypothetical protein A2Y16_00605 [Tenericutes bacterium GWF2_57_13]|nr:MAG: hypothetical protein A2Y16_00605 [Tenericutes bacterium GWF2_57_13]